MKKTKVLMILFFILHISLFFSLKVKQSNIFECNSLIPEPTLILTSNLSDKVKEYSTSELNVKDVSIRKGMLVACAALKSSSVEKFSVYTYNLEKNTFSLLSDEECDRVAVKMNGVVHLLRKNKVFFFEKGKWIPLDDSLNAMDLAFAHDTSTLYYLDSIILEGGGGVVSKKLENTKAEKMTGSAILIDAGINGDVFVINSYNHFYANKSGQGNWILNANKQLDLAACEDGTVYTIGFDGSIYLYDTNKNSLDIYSKSDKFEKITCGANSKHLFAVKSNKELFKV